MATGIPIKDLPVGVEWLQIIGGAFGPGAGRSVYVRARGTTTQVQVWQDAAMTTPLSQPLITAADGTIPGYIAPEVPVDIYDVASAQTAQAEPVSVADITANQSAISTETTRAEGAESAETTRAEAAEGTNASNITAETSRAEAAEGSNASAISTETSRAEGAEALLIPLSQKGAASGVMALDAGSRGAQPPKLHASDHAPGGADPLTTGDLPTSLLNDSRGAASQDLLVFNGSSFVRLPVGTTGQQLFVRNDGTIYYQTPPRIPLDAYYDDTTSFASRSAAIQAAVTAAQNNGQTLDCRAGRVYSLDTAAPQIAPGLPLSIEGRRATFQANWGKPRCLEFHRTADYQTFSDVDIRDLTFDANNITATVAQDIVGEAGTNGYQRLNYSRIFFRRCRWINVPVGAVGGPGYTCLQLQSVHLAGGETQTTITDIHVEQAYMRGGNAGAVIIGGCGTAVGVNVYLDRIYVEVDWDSGVVPNGSNIAPGSGVQIGSLGFGDYCEVRAVLANSGDVGIEIDGMQTAHIWGRVTDSWNANYFGRNFNAPPYPASQRYYYHGCEARVVNLNPDPSNPTSAGFQFGHTALPNPTFGEAVLEDCTFHSESANLRGSVGTALQVPQNGLVSAITIVGTFLAVYDKVNDAPGVVESATPICLLPAGTACRVAGGKLRVVYAGTGNANTKPRSVVLSPQTGCAMDVDLESVTIASSLAGVSAGNTRGLFIGVSGAGGGSIRGRIKRVGWEAFSGGDTTPQLLVLNPSGTITIDGRLLIDEVDLRKDPAASPLPVNRSASPDATNLAACPIRSANMPTYPIPSAAMSTNYFATANFVSGTGNRYVGGLPAEVQFSSGSGAGVTAIDVSKDGTTYENAYTQASGALAQSVTVPVENGDFVKVTFATTQPTARVRFRRAQ